jgi:hypothetical protein
VVAAEAGEGDDPADGGDLDEVPGLLRAEDRQDRLGDVEGPEQVGLQLVAELLS